MKGHEALQLRLAAALRGERIQPPSGTWLLGVLGDDPKTPGVFRQTPNMQIMAAAAELHRVFHPDSGASGPERAYAVKRAQRNLEQERARGMYRGEIFCPDSHEGLHLEGFVGVLRAALDYGIGDLLNDVLAWWGSALKLWRLLASPDGEPWGPGMRAAAAIPRREAAAAIVRELYGLQHRLSNGKAVDVKELLRPRKSKSGIPLAFETASLVSLREGLIAHPGLRGLLVDEERNAQLPRLAVPMHVRKWAGGHLAWLDKLPPQRNPPGFPCDWLMIEYGKPGAGKPGQNAVQVGRDWKTPVPQPIKKPVAAIEVRGAER